MFEQSVSCACLTHSLEMGPRGQHLAVCFSLVMWWVILGEKKKEIQALDRKKHGTIHNYFSPSH